MKVIHRLVSCCLTVVLFGWLFGLYHPPPRSIKLALLGDVMLGRGVGQALCRQGVCEWPLALSALTPVLSKADLALANLESPLTTTSMIRENYDLRADPSSAQALSAAGLHLVSLANNHSMDGGLAGLNDTLAAIQAWNLGAIGPGVAPIWRTYGSLRLAFLAFEDVQTPLDLKAAADAVRQAHETGALVIVSVHWGSEYQAEPNQRQKEMAQILADAGAALIWGHHPHVLQPLAWLQGTGQPFRTLVAYSLGNALFDQIFLPDTQHCAVLVITLNQKGVDEQIQVVPFEIDGLRGRVKTASPEVSEQVLQRLHISE